MRSYTASGAEKPLRIVGSDRQFYTEERLCPVCFIPAAKVRSTRRGLCQREKEKEKPKGGLCFTILHFRVT
jgi:hypothetical protein